MKHSIGVIAFVLFLLALPVFASEPRSLSDDEMKASFGGECKMCLSFMSSSCSTAYAWAHFPTPTGYSGPHFWKDPNRTDIPKHCEQEDWRCQICLIEIPSCNARVDYPCPGGANVEYWPNAGTPGPKQVVQIPCSSGLQKANDCNLKYNRDGTRH